MGYESVTLELDFSDEESQTLMGAKGVVEEEEEEEEGGGKVPKREEKAG